MEEEEEDEVCSAVSSLHQASLFFLFCPFAAVRMHEVVRWEDIDVAGNNTADNGIPPPHHRHSRSSIGGALEEQQESEHNMHDEGTNGSMRSATPIHCRSETRDLITFDAGNR